METRMEKNKTDLFNLVSGLKPVDPSKLAAFEREMTEEAIPKMIREVEKTPNARGREPPATFGDARNR